MIDVEHRGLKSNGMQTLQDSWKTLIRYSLVLVLFSVLLNEELSPPQRRPPLFSEVVLERASGHGIHSSARAFLRSPQSKECGICRVFARFSRILSDPCSWVGFLRWPFPEAPF